MTRQLEIAGTERPSDPDVEAAGDKHQGAIKKCTKANIERKDTKLELIKVMREKKITKYTHVEGHPPFTIDLTTEDKVKLSPYKGEVDSDEKRSKKKNAKRATDEDEGGDEVVN